VRRRQVLGALALAALASLGAGALIGDDFYNPPPKGPKQYGASRRRIRPAPEPFALPPHFVAPNLARVELPGGSLFDLPGDGNLMALTVDDGADTVVVADYIQFAIDTGMRLTFFLNGQRPAWTDNAAALRPLVESGQIQVANHTWSHPSLVDLSDGEIERELQVNDDFIRSTYGVESRPYFRPPYGFHDDRVDAVARSIGYSTPVMWYGSLSDSTLITDEQLMESATRWIGAQRIVIGHANYPTVTRHFTEIVDLIRSRGLVPVTLDDVFVRP